MTDRSKPMVESVVTAPVFVDGIGSITVENGVARLIFYVDQRDAYGLERERQVALRVIAPAAALVEIAGLMTSADGDRYASVCHRQRMQSLM